MLEYSKDWRINNKDRHNESCKKHKRHQRATNPTFVISNRINRAINYRLREGKGCKSWVNLLEYNPDDLKQHLESLFTDGMSWEEFLKGNIHIDHKKPISKFNFVKC